MGLKGYRLWGMGQLDSNVQSPHLGGVLAAPSVVLGVARDQKQRGEQREVDQRGAREVHARGDGCRERMRRGDSQPAHRRRDVWSQTRTQKVKLNIDDRRTTDAHPG
jgi:hypothetical protein